MKHLLIAALLLVPVAASATPAEDFYIAARDRYIEGFKKTADTKNLAARDKQGNLAMRDLGKQMRDIVGPVAIKGFSTKGKLDLDGLFQGDEGFGMLDGLVFGEMESAKSIVVTTDGLFERWTRDNQETLGGKKGHAPDEVAAIKSDTFYTHAVSTDTAVVHYADIPVPKPEGARFAHATLSARTQSESPAAPDMMFVSVALGGRVFIANVKLATPMKPIPACNNVRVDYAAKIKDVEAAYEATDRKDDKIWDKAEQLRDESDVAVRHCYGEKVKDMASFKAGIQQARAIVEALPAK
jgi:hypothetical protein